MAAVPAATGTRKRVLFPAPQTLHQAAEPPGQAPAASGAAAPRFGRPRFVSPAAIFAPSEDAGEWRERRPPADSEATCSFAQTEDSRRWLSRPGEAAAIDREPATGTHVPVRSQPPRALATPGSSAVDDECIDLTVPAHLGCLATKIVGMRHQSAAARRCEVGDVLKCVREPNNVSDQHAIQFLTSEQQLRLGYLPRTTAKLLAPLLDSDSIAVVARVTKRNVEGVGADVHLCVLQPVRSAQASTFTANAAATVSAFQLLGKSLAKSSNCKGPDAVVQLSPVPQSAPMRSMMPLVTIGESESAQRPAMAFQLQPSAPDDGPERHATLRFPLPALQPIPCVEPESQKRTLQLDVRR